MLEYIADGYVHKHGAKFMFMRCVFSFFFHLSRLTGMKWTMILLSDLRFKPSLATVKKKITTLKNVKATICTINIRPTKIWAGLLRRASSTHFDNVDLKKIVFTTGLNACFPLLMDFVGIHAAVNTSILGKMGDRNVNRPLHNRHATITPPSGIQASLWDLSIE